jgi:hypothetical protein
MLCKFTDAQRHYHVFEQEMIVILEVLLKWEDKLIRYCIHVVTDHQALEFFKTQDWLSSIRLAEWSTCPGSTLTFDISGVSSTK